MQINLTTIFLNILVDKNLDCKKAATNLLMFHIRPKNTKRFINTDQIFYQLTHHGTESNIFNLELLD